MKDDVNDGMLDEFDTESILKALPPAQPAQRIARVFQGIVVEYSSICAYPEYEGKPYFSIKYTENGQEFIGYGTYKPEVLSEYLKEYFMPPAQPGWIPCDRELPKPNEEDGNGFDKAYLVQDGRWMDVARWDGKYWVAWGYSTVLLNVVAWCELPTPYREGGQDGEG